MVEHILLFVPTFEVQKTIFKEKQCQWIAAAPCTATRDVIMLAVAIHNFSSYYMSNSMAQLNRTAKCILYIQLQCVDDKQFSFNRQLVKETKNTYSLDKLVASANDTTQIKFDSALCFT